MAPYSSPFSVMLLLCVFLSLFHLSTSHPHGHHHFHPALAGRELPTPTIKNPVPAKDIVVASPVSPCVNSNCATALPPPEHLSCYAANSTTFIDNGDNYTLICDIDFPDQNIYPFILAGSFDDCLAQCETCNHKNVPGSRCAGFVFAPERIKDADDCYLKSSLNNPLPATIHLVGATAATPTSTCTTALKSDPTPRSKHASSSSNLVVKEVRILGSSTNKPTTQYVSHVPATPEKLASGILVPGINTDLITKYPVAGDTGVWCDEDIPLNLDTANMKVVPHMSRDGGKGGTINSTHIFVFCDTASFQIDGTSSQMVGFVSSSVATDDGMKALLGQPLDLVDNLGEWQDDVGRMRGFAPMTTGEESFNIALSGDGYRYAVWPESSLIPLNASHALLYPALVYDVVDMSTQSAVFHDLGNCILLVSVDEKYGPTAQRVAKQIYQQDQVTYGTLGGIRSWGTSGVGGNSGNIYLFGQTDHGVLVARTTPNSFTDLSTYTYWDGKSWSNDMPSSSSNATMIDIPIQDLDLVYVPALRSFVMVYLNTLADNTFYYRHLPLDLDVDQNDEYDRIVTSQWSDEKVLTKIDSPAEGYIYAGGIHAGYFGDDDITNGGWKVLITWTEHTGKDAASAESGYAHKSAYVDFGLA
ncbi:hypothetical protein PV05_11712 [Exophiala xenobiotica]|uniref:Apple domain-containing protein n=1 Tax=Exophiala xenobiotica TaxID=348802 RepID=A0A0D2BD63_9EURO|nr:uncharacterized protein PV05_11712 [Exophiala xenobiotica]KIW50091.1 hypothetical protein PV05_11712 [Exophiala xenobiotica]